nr:hemerythrin domain-containing protein [uncultured Dongia sp.]
MRRLEWLKSFETGVDEIDEDHRNLFALATKIGEKVWTRDSDFTVMLTEFINAAQRHFAREEEILREAQFPGLDSHKRYHASLLSKAAELKAICDAEQEPKQADICYSAMIDFLIDDIVRGDSQFKSFLDHVGNDRRKKNCSI